MQYLYCIEGHWGYDWGEPSVEPMLDMVRSLGGWPYIRRNSATLDEMHYWLGEEWRPREKGSILYIASHGEPGRFWLTNADGYGDSKVGETLFDLAVKLEDLRSEKGHIVHFGGCQVLDDISDEQLGEFLEASGASAVSGYTEDAGWLAERRDRHGVIPPSLALEAMFFSSIMEKGIRLDLLKGNAAAAQERRRELRCLAKKLKCRFPECGFRLLFAE